MPPTVPIDLCFEAGRHPRRGRIVRRVADRAGRAGSATRAGVLTFPWYRRMALAHPAAVLADDAFHRSHHAQRELLPVDRVMSIEIRRYVAQMQITADRIAALICDERALTARAVHS
jgi:hypothetical protein